MMSLPSQGDPGSNSPSMPPSNPSVHDWPAVERVRRLLRLDPYRLRRFRQALYVKSAGLDQCFGEIPPALQDAFRDSLQFTTLTLISQHRSNDGSSKLVFETWDRRRIETVVMRSRFGRHSICLSSQAGCAAGCVFCATGYMGAGRNLTVGEIIEQATTANRLLRAENQRARNLVFMGMGEPFHNERHVAAALRILHHHEGFGVSQRRTLVSTVGAPEAMVRHARTFRRAPLAVSLHSAIQEKRESLIPVAKRCPLPQLADAMWQAAELQRQPIMIEYIMLAGRNDGPDDLQALAELVHGRPVLLNLIPYNTIPDAPQLVGVSRAALRTFADEMRGRGVTVTIRNSQGGDVAAACGQLANRFA